MQRNVFVVGRSSIIKYSPVNAGTDMNSALDCDLSALLNKSGAANVDDFVEFEIYFDDLPRANEEQCLEFLLAKQVEVLTFLNGFGQPSTSSASTTAEVQNLSEQFWNRDVFHLTFGGLPCQQRQEVSSRMPNVQFDGAEVMCGEGDSGSDGKASRVAEGGGSGRVGHLRGCMRVGDSVDDEWTVVGLLIELTKEFRTISARVVDMDGELLLIEAALTLPGWLNPQRAENRVWLRHGATVIIPPSATASCGSAIRNATSTMKTHAATKGMTTSSGGGTREVTGADGGCGELSLNQALESLKNDSFVAKCYAKPSTQRAVFQRVKKVQAARKAESTHYASCVMPSRWAAVICRYPQLVGVALDYLPPESIMMSSANKHLRAAENGNGGVAQDAAKSRAMKFSFAPSAAVERRGGEAQTGGQVADSSGNDTRLLDSSNQEEGGVAASTNDDDDDVPVSIGVRFTRRQFARFNCLKFKMPSEFTASRWKTPPTNTSSQPTAGDTSGIDTDTAGIYTGGSKEGASGGIRRKVDREIAAAVRRGGQLCLGLQCAYVATRGDWDALALMVPNDSGGGEALPLTGEDLANVVAIEKIVGKWLVKCETTKDKARWSEQSKEVIARLVKFVKLNEDFTVTPHKIYQTTASTTTTTSSLSSSSSMMVAKIIHMLTYHPGVMSADGRLKRPKHLKDVANFWNFSTCLRHVYRYHADKDNIPSSLMGRADDPTDWLEVTTAQIDAAFEEQRKEEKAFDTIRRIKKLYRGQRVDDERDDDDDDDSQFGNSMNHSVAPSGSLEKDVHTLPNNSLPRIEEIEEMEKPNHPSSGVEEADNVALPSKRVDLLTASVTGRDAKRGASGHRTGDDDDAVEFCSSAASGEGNCTKDASNGGGQVPRTLKDLMKTSRAAAADGGGGGDEKDDARVFELQKLGDALDGMLKRMSDYEGIEPDRIGALNDEDRGVLKEAAGRGGSGRSGIGGFVDGADGVQRVKTFGPELPDWLKKQRGQEKGKRQNDVFSGVGEQFRDSEALDGKKLMASVFGERQRGGPLCSLSDDDEGEEDGRGGGDDDGADEVLIQRMLEEVEKAGDMDNKLFHGLLDELKEALEDEDDDEDDDDGDDDDDDEEEEGGFGDEDDVAEMRDLMSQMDSELGQAEETFRQRREGRSEIQRTAAVTPKTGDGADDHDHAQPVTEETEEVTAARDLLASVAAEQALTPGPASFLLRNMKQ